MQNKTTLERIKEYIDYKGITIRAFELEVGFSNGSFASQLKNNKTIGVDKLENILNTYPEVNPTWLLTGDGDMLLDFTKGITGGADPIMDKEMNIISDNVNLLGNLQESNKQIKEISDVFNDIKTKIFLINAIVEEYQMINVMVPVLTSYHQKEIKMDKVKEMFTFNFSRISELAYMLDPYRDVLEEIYEKLSDFDERHEGLFHYDEETIAAFRNFKNK